MITTSNEYKQAIKEKVREFKPQIEMFLNKDSNYVFKTKTSYDTSLVYSVSDVQDAEEIKRTIDYNNFSYKYASLEQDYTLLDGSFILPNKNFINKNRGYIGEIENSSYLLKIDNVTTWSQWVNLTRRITIYFDGGYPLNFQIRCIPLKALYGPPVIEMDEMTFDFVGTGEMMTIYIPITATMMGGFAWDFLGFKEFEIIMNDWSVPNRRPRIRHIVNGTSILYEDNEIVDINLVEQTDIYNENLPSNELNMTLNNYDKKFNMLDYDNLYNSMDRETYFVASLGLNTSNGYEYLYMGRYAFSSYENTKDMLTKVKCMGAVEKYLNTDRQALTGGNLTIGNFANILKIAKHHFPDEIINPINSNFNSCREQAQALGMYTKSFIQQKKDIESCISNVGYSTYQNSFWRVYDYSLALEYINKNNIINIDESIEISYPEIKKREQLKTIKFNYIKNAGTKFDYVTIFDDDVYISEYNGDYEKYVGKIDIKTSTPRNTSYLRVTVDEVVNPTSGVRKGGNEYEVEVSILSDVSDIIKHVKIEIYEYNYSNQQDFISNPTIEDGDIVEYNNNYLSDRVKRNEVSKYIYSIDKEYEFSLEIMGDISLEVGDIIYFPTPYYKNMYGIIQSIETKYDGGLTQIIKGVCSNAL